MASKWAIEGAVGCLAVVGCPFPKKGEFIERGVISSAFETSISDQFEEPASSKTLRLKEKICLKEKLSERLECVWP